MIEKLLTAASSRGDGVAAKALWGIAAVASKAWGIAAVAIGSGWNQNQVGETHPGARTQSASDAIDGIAKATNVEKSQVQELWGLHNGEIEERAHRVVETIEDGVRHVPEPYGTSAFVLVNPSAMKGAEHFVRNEPNSSKGRISAKAIRDAKSIRVRGMLHAAMQRTIGDLKRDRDGPPLTKEQERAIHKRVMANTLERTQALSPTSAQGKNHAPSEQNRGGIGR